MKRAFLGELEEVVLRTVAAIQDRTRRPKRLSTITAAGQRVLIECWQVRAQLWEQIPSPILQLWGV